MELSGFNAAIERAVEDSSLKLIARDHRFELFTSNSSALAGIAATPEPPELSVQVVPAADPKKLCLEVSSPGNGGCSFCCAFSGARSKAEPFAHGHFMELAGDTLFALSTQPDNTVFEGNFGRLDATGRARFELDASPLRGGDQVAVYCSLVVFEGALVGQVRRIHRPVRIELGR